MPFQASPVQLRTLRSLSHLQIEGCDSADELGMVCPPRITFGDAGVPEVLLAAWVDAPTTRLKDELSALLARRFVERRKLDFWPLSPWIAPGEWRSRTDDGRIIILRWNNNATAEDFLFVRGLPGFKVDCPDPKAIVGGFALKAWSGSQRGMKLHNARMNPFWTEKGFGPAYRITDKGLDFVDELPPDYTLDDLVRLSQVTPLIGLSQKTLERHLKKGNLPTCRCTSLSPLWSGPEKPSSPPNAWA